MGLESVLLEAFTAVLIAILTASLGGILRHKGLVTPQFFVELASVTYHLFLPSNLFISVGKVFSIDNLFKFGAMLICGIIVTAGTWALARFLTRFMPVRGQMRRIAESTIVWGNSGTIPIPLTGSMATSGIFAALSDGHGTPNQRILAYNIFYIIPWSILLWSIGLQEMSRRTQEDEDADAQATAAAEAAAGTGGAGGGAATSGSGGDALPRPRIVVTELEHDPAVSPAENASRVAETVTLNKFAKAAHARATAAAANAGSEGSPGARRNSRAATTDDLPSNFRAVPRGIRGLERRSSSLASLPARLPMRSASLAALGVSTGGSPAGTPTAAAATAGSPVGTPAGTPTAADATPGTPPPAATSSTPNVVVAADAATPASLESAPNTPTAAAAAAAAIAAGTPTTATNTLAVPEPEEDHDDRAPSPHAYAVTLSTSHPHAELIAAAAKAHRSPHVRQRRVSVTETVHSLRVHAAERSRAVLTRVTGTPWLKRGLLTPPVVAALLACAIGSVPIIHNLLFLDYPPVIDSIMQSIQLFANAQTACTLLCLGANIASQNPDKNSSLPPQAIALAVAGRLFIAPLLWAVAAYIAFQMGLLPNDPLFLVVLMAHAATPGATHLNIITSLTTRGTHEMATILFWQYAISTVTLPLILTGWIGLVFSPLFGFSLR